MIFVKLLASPDFSGLDPLFIMQTLNSGKTYLGELACMDDVLAPRSLPVLLATVVLRNINMNT